MNKHQDLPKRQTPLTGVSCSMAEYQRISRGYCMNRNIVKARKKVPPKVCTLHFLLIFQCCGVQHPESTYPPNISTPHLAGSMLHSVLDCLQKTMHRTDVFLLLTFCWTSTKRYIITSQMTVKCAKDGQDGPVVRSDKISTTRQQPHDTGEYQKSVVFLLRQCPSTTNERRGCVRGTERAKSFKRKSRNGA